MADAQGKVELSCPFGPRTQDVLTEVGRGLAQRVVARIPYRSLEGVHVLDGVVGARPREVESMLQIGGCPMKGSHEFGSGGGLARFWMVWCVVPGTKLSMRQAPSDVGTHSAPSLVRMSLGVSMPRSAMCAVMASMSWWTAGSKMGFTRCRMATGGSPTMNVSLMRPPS